jgi:hypothetical protein
MPAATPIRIRQEIVERRQAGASYATIARDLCLPYVTVRQVYQHYHKSGQLPPHYDRCRHSGIRKDEAIYERAIQMKREHPRWGAGLIWVELAEEFAEKSLPSLRTLQRWFRQAQVQTPRGDKGASIRVYRGEECHEVWAIDAKEQMRLLDGSDASWLTITDEASGAILTADFFPDQVLDKRRSPGSQEPFTKGDESMGASDVPENG